jgi:LPXTG-motif cell wall-anchored protein
MIFGASQAEEFVTAVQTTTTKLLTDIINSPTATPEQKAKAQEALTRFTTQANAVWATKPSFFAQNQTPILIGSAAILLGGLGYWLVKRRKRR